MPRLAKSQPHHPGSVGEPRFKSWCATAVVCATLLTLAGCSRSFWRQNADANTYAILQDKSSDPRWSPPRLDLQPDVRSRFFDPYDPDCEPLPPDDPTAHTYMHWMGRNTGIAKVDQPWTGGVLPPWLYPQKPIHGWKSWHKFGDTLSVENPQWLDQFGLSPEKLEEQRAAGFAEGPGLPDLTLPQAIELSYIHSRDFQLALETLYSTSLALTFERFRFDVRYLGLGGARPSVGLTRNQTNGVETATLTPAFGISQLLPSGGQWIVEMTNNTLWLFTGGNNSSTASTLSYSLVQPLLLGAGRQVNLENLTQAERNALYAMRTFARFRQTFFVNNVSDYLGLLQNYQTILNQRYNIKLLEQQSERSLALGKEAPPELKVLLPGPPELPENYDLPELPDTYEQRLSIARITPQLADLRWRGAMSQAELTELKRLLPIPAIQDALTDLYSQAASKDALSLDAAQLLTQLANSRISLMSAERGLQDNLDGYKFQLGLPPDLWMTLDVKLVRPFQLISPDLLGLEERLRAVVAQTGVLPENRLVSNEIIEATDNLLGLTNQVIGQGLQLLTDDMEAVQANTENRLASLPPTLPNLEVYKQGILNDYARDQRLLGGIRQELDSLLARLKSLQVVLQNRQKGVKPKPDEIAERIDPVRELSVIRERVLKAVQNMEVVQVNLRSELINLNKFDMTIEQVVQTALENRVDLMNQRAIVMDARRKIEVLANTLRSQLNVTAQGDINTVPLGNGSTAPFEFRRDQSSYRLGVQFTAPLDQVQQRNAYRQGLITYQQARRLYMQTEDSIKQTVRTEWRQLTTLRTQFEISRKNIRTTAMQYDAAVEDSLKPSTGGGAAGGGSSNTSGLKLLNALSAILTAQNSIIQQWVNYETNRLNIHQDMGIMQIDDRGVWIDDYYQAQFPPLPVTIPADGDTGGGVAVPAAVPADAPGLIPPEDPAQP